MTSGRPGFEKKYHERLPRVNVDEKGRKWFVAEGIRPSLIREAPRDQSVPVDEFIDKASEGRRSSEP